MRARKLSFTTFNLYNLNQPGLRMYKDSEGWSEEEFAKKIGWTRFMLQVAKADVFGFQELWHAESLKQSFAAAELDKEYRLLIPEDHAGEKIVCAGAVRDGMLEGVPEWITNFPQNFRLESKGHDAQTPAIKVELKAFSRPVLHFKIRPREDQEAIHVYVCHFKSKGPTPIYRESWYNDDRDAYKKHSEAIGSGLSTIRRTAEATALRIILTEQLKNTHTPVVVLGDLNDGQHSNTLNILTSQPRYLTGLSKGGGDIDLYAGQTCSNTAPSAMSTTPTSTKAHAKAWTTSWFRRSSTTIAVIASGHSMAWKFTTTTLTARSTRKTMAPMTTASSVPVSSTNQLHR